MIKELLDKLFFWWLKRRGIIRKYDANVAVARDWNMATLRLYGHNVPLLEQTVCGENNDILELWVVMYDLDEFERFRLCFAGNAATIQFAPGQEPVSCLCTSVSAKHTKRWPAALARFILTSC